MNESSKRTSFIRLSNTEYVEFICQWQDLLSVWLHGDVWVIQSLINEKGNQVPISPK